MTDPYQTPSAPLGAENVENTSGMGKGAAIPEGIKGLSWGGFILSWIWAIGNSTWIGLLAIIPYVGWIMSFVLLFKGREWAWQNKRWESVEHFNRVQKKWTVAGLIVIGIAFALGILLGIVGAMNQ